MKHKIKNLALDIIDLLKLLYCLAFGHVPVGMIGIAVCTRCYNGPDKVAFWPFSKYKRKDGRGVTYP